MADKAPEDQMFAKSGKSSKGDSFSKMHKKGGAMHKKGKAAAMNTKTSMKGGKR